MTKYFPTIVVTQDFHDSIEGLERNIIAVMRAAPDEVEDAQHCLSLSKKFLYEYIEDIEQLAELCPHIPRTHLRFT